MGEDGNDVGVRSMMKLAFKHKRTKQKKLEAVTRGKGGTWVFLGKPDHFDDF